MSLALDTAASQNSLQGRALELLGSGVPQESVASALGVTPSYISQLLADEDFATEVSKRRYTSLTQHTERDSKYDALEDKLLGKLEKALPLMFKPLDITRALTAINGAKRRGLDSTEAAVPAQNIVQITMPTQIIKNFTTNQVNQVIVAGEQDLTTIQSGELLKRAESAKGIEESNNSIVETIKEEEQQLFEPSNTLLESL